MPGRQRASERGGEGPPRLTLRRGARPPLPAPDLDPRQQAAVDHRGGPLRLLGAPGTGVTTTVVEAVVGRIERGELTADEVLVLAPTRLAAAALREQVTGRLARTIREPIARTPAALAFGVLRRAAAAIGEPAPRLLSGPEQDVVLRDLLEGHARGAGRAPQWPEPIRAALRTRGFRTELRDLMTRAVERGLGSDDLADVGREHGRPEWVAAAQLLAEYDEVTALASPGAYDPARILAAAEATLVEQPDILDEVRRSARFVAVDDAQELTPAAYQLLSTLVGPGGEVLLAGDPDSATLGFRGADPGLLAERYADLAAPDRAAAATGSPGGVPTIVLATSWRQGPALRAATRRVVERVGAVTRSEVRRPAPAPERAAGVVRAHVLRSPAQEAAFLAGELRRAHLERGLPWGEMAVIVRGTGRAATIRRVLAAEGVPVHIPATEVPVREESAVAPLVSAFQTCLALVVATDRGGSEDEGSEDEGSGHEGSGHEGSGHEGSGRGEPALDVDTVVDLLTSPIGGADAVSMRRLRRALRAEDRAGGGRRGSDELLVEAVAAPGRLASLEPATAAPARRVAAVLAAGCAAARRETGADGAVRFAPGVSAETVLWAIWSASGLSEPWRRVALAGGTSGRRADRDLDAVVALFDAAARFVDRLPQAGPAEFLDHLLGQEVPGDTLVERAPASDAVALLTPQGAAGREWALVAVAGVQTGVWPDTRLRGSLLGAQALVDVLAGRGDGTPEALRSAQAAVRHEELRLFHVAVSRAREELLVTAVSGEDEQPSGLLELVAPDPGGAGSAGHSTPSSDLLTDLGHDASTDEGDDDERWLTPVRRALSLPALVARLRQVLTAEEATVSPAVVQEASAALARLARAGVAGADPADWHGLAPVSDPSPIVPPDDSVLVSPSKVDSYEQCGLRWVLEASGGSVASALAQNVGNLIHDIASAHPEGSEEVLRAALDARWASLGLPDGWVAREQRSRADDMVARLAVYYRRMLDQGRSLVDVERKVTVEVGRAVVSGRVDRLEQTADGALYIVDLKTGRTQVSDDDVAENRQLAVYQLAVQEGGFADGPEDGRRVSAGGELVMLGVPRATLPTKVQPALPPVGDVEVGADWARRVLAEVADGMAGASFTAQQGPHCRGCPVRTSCPTQSEGRQVAG